MRRRRRAVSPAFRSRRQLTGGERMMEETTAKRSGPIDGTSRILRELLRTPRFKKSVNVLLSELDPENAAELVRTLMWEDPEFFLSLFAAVPDLANAVVAALLELSGQLGNFPPGLLASFLAIAVEKLDVEGLGRTVAGVSRLLAGVRDGGGPEFTDALSGALKRFARGLTGVTPAEDQPSVSLESAVIALIPVISSAVARFGSEAAREGSDANLAVARLAAAVEETAAANPLFVKSVALPLFEAGKQALRVAGAAEGGEVR